MVTKAWDATTIYQGSPARDSRLCELAEEAMRCSLGKRTGCVNCLRVVECGLFWDKVSQQASQHRLKAGELEKFRAEFMEVSNGGRARHIRTRATNYIPA